MKIVIEISDGIDKVTVDVNVERSADEEPAHLYLGKILLKTIEMRMAKLKKQMQNTIKAVKTQPNHH